MTDPALTPDESGFATPRLCTGCVTVSAPRYVGRQRWRCEICGTVFQGRVQEELGL